MPPKGRRQSKRSNPTPSALPGSVGQSDLHNSASRGQKRTLSKTDQDTPRQPATKRQRVSAVVTENHFESNPDFALYPLEINPKPHVESGTHEDALLCDHVMPDHHDDPICTGRTYFEAHKGAVATTNLTLASLSICSPEKLSEAIAQFHDPTQANQEKQVELFRHRHNDIEYILDAGHSILVYGFGSKRVVLDDFAAHLSLTRDVILIHGFNPTTSLRIALTQLASDLLSLKAFPKRSLLDYVDAIRDKMEMKKSVISVVVHNIDGPALRSADSQLALSKLASVEGIQFVASVDHVNTPLLWDAPMYTSFSWMWVRCQTFRSYSTETFFSSKPLLRGGTERRVEGAIALLNSLTKNACSVFRELALRQMQGEEGLSSSRITFNELFKAVKEVFLLSDAGALRNILTELKTHDLLQTRRCADAAEQLWIPLQDAQLEAVLTGIGLEI